MISARFRALRSSRTLPGHFLGYVIDRDERGDSARSIYIAYNGWQGGLDVALPPVAPGHAWYRAADTSSWMEGQDNFKDPGAMEALEAHDAATYGMSARSVLVLVEQPR